MKIPNHHPGEPGQQRDEGRRQQAGTVPGFHIKTTLSTLPLILLVLLAILLPANQVDAETKDTRLLLFYSNDVRAELEPCG